MMEVIHVIERRDFTEREKADNREAGEIFAEKSGVFAGASIERHAPRAAIEIQTEERFAAVSAVLKVFEHQNQILLGAQRVAYGKSDVITLFHLGGAGEDPFPGIDAHNVSYQITGAGEFCLKADDGKAEKEAVKNFAVVFEMKLSDLLQENIVRGAALHFENHIALGARHLKGFSEGLAGLGDADFKFEIFSEGETRYRIKSNLVALPLQRLVFSARLGGAATDEGSEAAFGFKAVKKSGMLKTKGVREQDGKRRVDLGLAKSLIKEAAGPEIIFLEMRNEKGKKAFTGTAKGHDGRAGTLFNLGFFGQHPVARTADNAGGSREGAQLFKDGRPFGGFTESGVNKESIRLGEAGVFNGLRACFEDCFF